MKHALPIVAGATIALLLVFGRPVSAHSPICDCFHSEERTAIVCEGGFTDGSSAEGVPIRVLDVRDRVIASGVMNEKGIFTFRKPEQTEFRIVFDAGRGHVVTVLSEDIE